MVIFILAMVSYVMKIGRRRQGNKLLTRIMDLSQAATITARTGDQHDAARPNAKGRFGDGTRVLKARDVFETHDPVGYSLRREQFMNWLVFCDSRSGRFDHGLS